MIRVHVVSFIKRWYENQAYQCGFWIAKQVSGYDFIKKLKDSIDICNDYASNVIFCNADNLAYIIVTDIDIKAQPLQAFLSNLMALAQHLLLSKCYVINI